MQTHLPAVPRCANGYILLLSVLVVGAVGSAIAVSLLLLGLGSSRTSFALLQSVQARSLASTCAEAGLEGLRLDSSYAGGETLTLESGDCTVTVLGTGDTDRTVQAVGTAGDVVRYLEVEASAVTPTMTIASWQEVDGF